MDKLLIVIGVSASTVTIEPFAIITSSDEVGNTPPTHVAVLSHKPPAVVEVIVAAFEFVDHSPERIRKTIIKIFPLKYFLIKSILFSM